MKELSFISQRIDDFLLTLFFDEKQNLVFVSLKNDFLMDVQKNFKKVIFRPQVTNQKNDLIFNQLKQYFQKNLQEFNFDYKLYGTGFQIQVWNELNQIKYGEILSYSEIAQRINRPKAIRAVATAIGMNPLPIIIPCHRVNGKDNNLHGYRGGLALKQNLQKLETEI